MSDVDSERNAHGESATNGRSTAADRHAGPAPPAVVKRRPTSWLSRLWDSRWSFTGGVVVTLGVVPLVAFLGIGAVEGTFVLPGDANGIFEDPIFLSYFPVAVSLALAVRYALETQYAVINSLQRRGVVQFAGETDGLADEYPRYASDLTVADAEAMFQFYDFLLATATFRGDPDAVSCPEAYRPLYRKLRILLGLTILGGLVALGVGTYYHWFATQAYGFDIWASSTYPLGFAARFGYEVLLYLVVGPILLHRLAVSIMLVYHPLYRLQTSGAIRFRRFAPDEAGGFGLFGVQSFRNVLALTPLLVPIVAYALFYPTTEFLLAGLVLYAVAAPVVFVGQLLRAHRAMKEMKRVELDIIGDPLTENYDLFRERLLQTDSMDDVDDEELATQGEILEKADVVYNDVRKQTTWPFGKTQLGQVLSLMTFVVGLLFSLL